MKTFINAWGFGAFITLIVGLLPFILSEIFY